ncbi:MAG TPA: hypothetical protein VHF06_20405, partial [Pseudonocardiaceae bacterium]|nr:hypothetical protein [Pseudonocardiaceae bacterium]
RDRAGLLAMPQHTATLPIACVEGLVGDPDVGPASGCATSPRWPVSRIHIRPTSGRWSTGGQPYHVAAQPRDSRSPARALWVLTVLIALALLVLIAPIP